MALPSKRVVHNGFMRVRISPGVLNFPTMEFKFKHENPTYENIEVIDGTYFAKVRNTFNQSEFDFYKFTIKGDTVDPLIKVADYDDETIIVVKTDVWDLPYVIQALYAKEIKGEFITEEEFAKVFKTALAKINSLK